jgi:hypothetical protein
MQTLPFNEIKLKLPSGIVGTISEKEIIEVVETISEEKIISKLIDNSLSKAKHYLEEIEHYLQISKYREVEKKYRTRFASLKEKVKEAEKKVVAKSDDLVVC